MPEVYHAMASMSMGFLITLMVAIYSQCAIIKTDQQRKNMTTNEKLEVFRKINCLGIVDIEKAFADQPSDLVDHLIRKYEGFRKSNGAYGNFKFLFELDLENAKILFNSVGL